MPFLTGIAATTETEALNGMLMAIGRPPVPSIDTVTSADAVTAKEILKGAYRETLGDGWMFNTEFGYEVQPAGTQVWVGTDGTSETLNVFEVPTNMISGKLAKTSAQRELDVVIRPGNVWDPTKMIFYDRGKNRDGFVATTFPKLYVDPVWLFPFERCPDSVRFLIQVRATRIFVQGVVGSQTLAGFTQFDEARAFQRAVRDQRPKRFVSVLSEGTALSAIGRNRRGAPRGVIHMTDSPGKV